MESLYATILAAGLGTRMKSRLPKVLHQLSGKPMLGYVLETVEALSPAGIILVVGPGGEKVKELYGNRAVYAFQAEQLGTGHALGVAVGTLAEAGGDLLVVYGDMPLLTRETLAALVGHHRTTGAAATLLTTRLGETSRFGRIIRAENGRFLRIVEYRDAAPAERAIPEVNVGVYCFRLESLREFLPGLDRNNAQGEYYLTDLFPLYLAAGKGVEAIPGADPGEFEGPNDRAELAAVESRLRQSVNRHWLDQGVTIVDPQATYIETGVTIGRDTLIYPGTTLRGRTEVGEGCRLGPYAEIQDSRLGMGVAISYSVVLESEIGAQERVGPFVYLRRGVATGGAVPAVTGPRRLK